MELPTIYLYRLYIDILMHVGMVLYIAHITTILRHAKGNNIIIII